MSESIDFGDNVRIVDSPETQNAGIAGLVGNVYGVTTPSVTGINPLGHSGVDRAYNVHFDSTGTDIWLAPHLVSFVDHGAGAVATIDGVSKQWVRIPSGQWAEEPGGTIHRSLLERFLAFFVAVDFHSPATARVREGGLASAAEHRPLGLMNTQPLFGPEQLENLLSQKSISSAMPWSANVRRDIDAHLRAVCDEVMQRTGTLSRIEWNHYGSGYASFVDAWFYRPTAEFAVPEALAQPRRQQQHPPHGEKHFGLVVLLSRLSTYFVFMEGQKQWHDRGGSSYLPSFEAVDGMSCMGVISLAQEVQPILEQHGLQRLYQDDLATLLPEGTSPPTILTEWPYREFDSLFYWRDY